MKILLVINKTINRNGTEVFDSGYFNLYVPFLELGHQVYFYDIADKRNNNSYFLQTVKEFKPDLIFCCLTGNQRFMVGEPNIELFEEITKKGNIKTFNWFCDDTWRFESFSSKICNKFTCCSTPEPTYVQKYKDIGYNNIILGGWHSNPDLYINIHRKRIVNVGFCGGLNQQRQKIFQIIQNSGCPLVEIKQNISYEDMLDLYCRSKIGVNFSVNANNGLTQMKQRVFEIPAAKALLITEYTKGLEEFFELNKEIITFTSQRELFDKIKFYLNNEFARKEIAQAGFVRFTKEHTSRIRLTNILKQIGEI